VSSFPETSQEKTTAFRNAVNIWLGTVAAAEEEHEVVLPSILAVRDQFAII
jgi:hypothetical protein